MRHWRLAMAALALAVYAVVSYGLMVRMPGHGWTVLALFGPLIAGVALGAWVRRHGPTLAGCAALAAGLAWLVARGGSLDLQRLYVLQHAAIHAVLAWGFAITLREGSTPLITALAQRVHRHFTPDMRAYTRALTALWVGYFVGMIVISLALYALAPWRWWSFYCTLLTPLAAVALFVGEHFWRYWRHPEFERASLVQAWQAYRQYGAPPPQPPGP